MQLTVLDSRNHKYRISVLSICELYSFQKNMFCYFLPLLLEQKVRSEIIF